MSKERVKQLVCAIADVLDELMDELGIDDIPPGGDPDYYLGDGDESDEERSDSGDAKASTSKGRQDSTTQSSRMLLMRD